MIEVLPLMRILCISVIFVRKGETNRKYKFGKVPVDIENSLSRYKAKAFERFITFIRIISVGTPDHKSQSM